MRRQRHLRPRRLVADEELFRRRVQGVTLRELASDYGVSHTTLSRHLDRPDAKTRLKETRIALRREQRERREEVRRAARERREMERERREQMRRVYREIEAETAAAQRAVETSSRDVSAAEVIPEPIVEPPARPVVAVRGGRHVDPYLDRLDLRDHGRPLTRRERWSVNDELAAKAVASGGGMAAVIEVTGLRTEENVRRLIDPDIVAGADRNDAALLEGA